MSTASINGTPAPNKVLIVRAIIEDADFVVNFPNKGAFSAIFPKKCFPASVLANARIANTNAIITGIIINQ